MSCVADLADLSSAINSEYVVISNDHKNVEIDATNEARLNIWSVGGVKVGEYNILEGRNTIDIKGLVGLYIFEFIDENNFQEIQQVVLSK
jgi:hypothetical protein